MRRFDPLIQCSSRYYSKEFSGKLRKLYAILQILVVAVTDWDEAARMISFGTENRGPSKSVNLCYSFGRIDD